MIPCTPFALYGCHVCSLLRQHDSCKRMANGLACAHTYMLISLRYALKVLSSCAFRLSFSTSPFSFLLRSFVTCRLYSCSRPLLLPFTLLRSSRCSYSRHATMFSIHFHEHLPVSVSGIFMSLSVVPNPSLSLPTHLHLSFSTPLRPPPLPLNVLPILLPLSLTFPPLQRCATRPTRRPPSGRCRRTFSARLRLPRTKRARVCVCVLLLLGVTRVPCVLMVFARDTISVRPRARAHALSDAITALAPSCDDDDDPLPSSSSYVRVSSEERRPCARSFAFSLVHFTVAFIVSFAVPCSRGFCLFCVVCVCVVQLCTFVLPSLRSTLCSPMRARARAWGLPIHQRARVSCV